MTALKIVWEWEKIGEKCMFSCFDKNQIHLQKEIRDLATIKNSLNLHAFLHYRK